MISKSLGKVCVQLLAASSDDQVDEVFESIFDIVHDARDTGDAKQLIELLNWASQSDVSNILNHEILLSILRLTASMKCAFPEQWRSFYKSVRDELESRNINAAHLLCGLDQEINE